MPSPSSQLKHYTLQAAAGAGKTTHLIQQVIQSMHSFKEKSQKPIRIMITTFTRKAAGEVKERMMKYAVKEKNWELVNAVSDTSQIFISTLHGILYYFLKKYHPRWFSFSHIINERQIESSARTALKDLFESDPSYIPLMEHYKYDEILKLILQHKEDLIHFQPLSKQEMCEQWSKTFQSITQTNFSIDLSDLDNLQEKFIKYKKEIPDKTSASLFDKLFTACHPKNFKKLEDHFLLLHKLVQNFHSHWGEIKEKQGFIQMQDLESKTLQIIQKKEPSVSAFSKEWRAWFIDEYQDINHVQEKILNAFTQKAEKLWVVGDPQQSIYLFRKADPNVFKRRMEKTKAQGVLEVKNKNFRSHTHLIEFFNNFFGVDFHPMTPGKKESQTKESAVQFLICENNQDEKNAVAQKLQQLLKNSPPGHICVLQKTNQDVINTGYFLKKLKLPVQIHSQNTLKREIIDALFFLKFLINPLDTMNLIGLLRTPYLYLPDWEIALHSKKDRPLWVNLNQEMKLHPTIKALNTLMKKSRQEGISEAFSSFLEDHLVIDLCHRQDPSGERENNLWSLLTEMKIKEQNIHFTYYQFVEEKLHQFKTFSASEGGISSPLLNFIQLMTIHQSKGLEFEHVIIPSVDAPLIPPDSDRLVVSSEDQRWGFSLYNENKEAFYSVQQKLWKNSKKSEHLLEQDRLLYVAMTRAKKTLTLTCLEKNLMQPSNLNTWTGRFKYFTKIKKQMEENSDQNPIHFKEKSYSVNIQKI